MTFGNSRQTFITRRSSGTVQLAQLLKCICLSTQGKTVAFVGIDEEGEPTEVNEYCTMFVEKFPCEGSCWRDTGDPPLTDHVTIVTPSLVVRVCTEFKCGSFFILDMVDAPAVASLPYEVQKGAMEESNMWFKKHKQEEVLEEAVLRHRLNVANDEKRRKERDATAQTGKKE